jgi:hypothetical protein
MQCEYCNKTYTNKSGFSNHVRRCPSNPNRVMEKHSEAGLERIRASATEQNKKQWVDPEFRIKHQAAMKKAVLENPESYSSSNRGRTKQQLVDGIKLQGQWEVDFYNWAKEKGLNPEKPTKAFKYIWNGERMYHPDFYIPSMDLYIEVKGYETDRDRAKWSHFPEKLKVIKADEIEQIRKGCFAGL